MILSLAGIFRYKVPKWGIIYRQHPPHVCVIGLAFNRLENRFLSKEAGYEKNKRNPVLQVMPIDI